MDLHSFTIGILTMVVFAIATMAVLGMVKVVELTKQLVTLTRRIEDDERELSNEINMVEQTIMNQVRNVDQHLQRGIDECHRHTDEVLRQCTSYTDSRIDKVARETGAKQIIKG